MNLNNFIVTKNIDIFMLDWEWIEVGDPLIDVGYAYHNIKHAFGVRNINKKGIRMASHFLKAYSEKATYKVNPTTLKYYLFSTGLREAIYLRYLKEQIENLSFAKRFGLIYFPMSLYLWWHYRSRYKHLEEYLRSVAMGYEDAMFRTAGGKILSKMELEKILRFLKAESKELILDIGVGSGRVSREVSKIGADVVAVDVDREAILSAKIRQYPAKYDVILADGQFLPFKSCCFDGIVCIRTLKYFPDYHLGISEMSRVLKPNGRLIVDFSSMFGYESLLRHVTPVVSARGAHVFNFYKIRNLLTYYGLITEKCAGLQKIPHNFWNLFDNKITLRLLLICEEMLGRLTPEIFSRSILVRCVKKAQVTV
jgi:ubiquinone/menaquinone biosynthesis C-methylase UbiE